MLLSYLKKRKVSRNDHSLSLVVVRCHSLYHLLPFVITRCHSLSFVVPLFCHSLATVVPFVVTRCHSLLLVVTLCTIRCHSLSIDLPLVCLFINDEILLDFLYWFLLMSICKNRCKRTCNSSDCVVENIKLYKKLNSDISAHYTVLNKIVRYS